MSDANSPSNAALVHFGHDGVDRAAEALLQCLRDIADGGSELPTPRIPWSDDGTELAPSHAEACQGSVAGTVPVADALAAEAVRIAAENATQVVEAAGVAGTWKFSTTSCANPAANAAGMAQVATPPHAGTSPNGMEVVYLSEAAHVAGKARCFAEAAVAAEEAAHSADRAEVEKLQQELHRKACEIKDLKAQLAREAKERTEHSEEVELLRSELTQKEVTFNEVGRASEKMIVSLKTQLAADTCKAEEATANSTELKKLRSELHDKTYHMLRLEGYFEREMDGYANFLAQIARSSACPTLEQHLNLSTAEVLGMGNYAYVLTCLHRETKERVVVKVQSPRWASVAVREWMHGSGCGKHANIVEYKEVFMHRDSSDEIQRLIEGGFKAGSLTGQAPTMFPDCLLCFVLEYMDRGTLQDLVDRRLLDVEGMVSVTRQVAAGLAFMHHRKRTHNDIKPENVLLRQDTWGDRLIVKVADLGLAEHSADRSRDQDLFAYTMWCMGLGEAFSRCPRGDEEKAAAVEAFQATKQAAKDKKLWRALGKVIRDSWSGELEMAEVESLDIFAGYEVRVAANSELEHAARGDLTRKHDNLMRSLSLSLDVGALEDVLDEMAASRELRSERL